MEGQNIPVEQSLGIWVNNTYRNAQGPDDFYKVKLIDKKLSDTYALAVDQSGALVLNKVNEVSSDDSQKFDMNVMDWWSTKELLLDAQQGFNELTSGHLHDMELSKLHSFVFPGAQVFTYKNPFWSDHYDRISEITYLDVNQVSPPQQSPSRVIQENPSADQKSTAEDSLLLSHDPRHQTLTATTELMQNYVHGELVSPTGKFEALQSNDGHALLFSIDYSGVFHVIEEQSGALHTGWKVHDLSTAAIHLHFPGQESRAIVRTFDVNQSAVDGSIGFMMTVQTEEDNDHLLISLGNSNSDTSWAAGPVWTMVPFDPINENSRKIVITGTLFGESQDSNEYLVVDVRRPSAYSAHSNITRYHIDPKPVTGHFWVKHDVSIDIEAGNYQSCVGRVHKGFVDGIYTAGTVGGRPQFVYEPIVNVWGHGPPQPRRPHLPGGRVPGAIATARNTDWSTDLYAVGTSKLYRFAPEQQNEGTEPARVLTNDTLSGTDTLRAMVHDGVTTLWGRNGGNQVYYLACPTSLLDQPEAWSAPVPILFGVERMSPFVNRADGGNTIFTADNGRFQKLTQGSVETGRIWKAQEITVATSSATQQPLTFQSYTTTIHVAQKSNDLPEPNAVLRISANSRRPVYINGLYYALSPTPVRWWQMPSALSVSLNQLMTLTEQSSPYPLRTAQRSP